MIHRLLCASLFIVLLLGAQRVSPPVPNNSAGDLPQTDFATERQKADEEFLAGRVLDALPLYEDLEKRDPTKAVFAERHAAGLIAKAATVTTSAQSSVLMNQAYEELLRAQSLGDHSQYLVNQLEHFKALFAEPSTKQAVQPKLANPKVTGLMKDGEAAFAKNDYANALRAYATAAQEDPTVYESALFAGDAAFRLHDFAVAGQWFTKAIAIDPNMETAYRYSGDALMAANQFDSARQRFIDAVIAQPYSRSSWAGLTQWAQRTHTSLTSPRIDRPQPSSDPQALSIDPKLTSDDGSGRSAWVTYLVGRITYRNALFHKKFPDATQYRHTLAEELDCLQHVVAEVKKRNLPPDKIDPSIKVLMALDASHMLEPWILLHGADEGIAQDYPNFRATHRDRLQVFIEQYDIVGAPQSPSGSAQVQ